MPIIEWGDTFTPAHQAPPTTPQAVFTTVVNPTTHQASDNAEPSIKPPIFKRHEEVDMHIYQSFLANCKF